METGIPARLSAAEGRKFGLVVGLAWLVLGAITGARGHAITGVVLAILGLTLIAAGLIAPAQLGPVYRAWMGLAAAISSVTTPVFMGAVYFLVLTPLGLARRLARKNALIHGRGMGSCWIARRADDRRPAAMEHQF
jgi:hypothetical protein